jgi:hypothetical protein
MSQNQVGTNTTSSSPCVVPGTVPQGADVIYFRGTDDRLLKVNSDGTGFTQIGTNKTSSSPFFFSDPVNGDWLYFQGLGDNKLWKVRPDGAGSELAQIGSNTTNSTPFAMLDAATGDVWIYFQGTDDRLLKVKSDGNGFTQIGTNKTDSSPFAFSDPVGGDWLYFRGHNDEKLWKVRPDSAGSDLTQIGTNTTRSTPFVTIDRSTGDVWIYFQGKDNKLWKVRNDGAGSGLSNIGGNFTQTQPYVSEDGWVYFRGTPSGPPPFQTTKLWRVFNDGTQQTQLADNITSSTPKVGAIQFAEGQISRWVYFQEELDNKLLRYLQTDDPITTGTMRPKYYVLTVLYAPPGTSNGGTSGTLVDYGSSSATGTKTSVSSAFKDELDVGVTFATKDVGVNAQFSMSSTTTDATSLQIQKAETFDIKIPGPAKDGVDHDHDVFVILLNPLLQVALFPGNVTEVAVGLDGPVMNIQYVYAGWLKNVGTMAPGVKQQLDAGGLDASDYAQILSTNPFASGPADIDTNRFRPLSESLAYEPPYSADDKPWMETYSVQNTTTNTSDEKVEIKYSVGLSTSLTNILKITGSFEWTNTNETETTSGSTESASVTLGGPSFGYTGNTEVVVYWDSVFHSFMFAIPDTLPAGVRPSHPGRRAAVAPVPEVAH